MIKNSLCLSLIRQVGGTIRCLHYILFYYSDFDCFKKSGLRSAKEGMLLDFTGKIRYT
jgi:hypothetical protein